MWAAPTKDAFQKDNHSSAATGENLNIFLPVLFSETPEVTQGVLYAPPPHSVCSVILGYLPVGAEDMFALKLHKSL